MTNSEIDTILQRLDRGIAPDADTVRRLATHAAYANLLKVKALDLVIAGEAFAAYLRNHGHEDAGANLLAEAERLRGLLK